MFLKQKTLSEIKKIFISSIALETCSNCLSQVQHLESFCTWLLAITGATIGFGISNYDKWTGQTNFEVLKLAFWILLVSFSLGTAAKVMIVNVGYYFRMLKENAGFVKEKKDEFLKSFELLDAQEKKMFDEESFQKEVIVETKTYFPWFKKRFIETEMKKGIETPFFSAKRFSKRLFRAELYMYLQLFTFVSSLFVAIFAIKK